MADNNKVVVELGRVIKNRREYNPDASPLVKYFEENIVQKQGNSYIAYPTALVNDGVLDGKYYLTRAPYNDDPQTPNAGWEVFASGKHNFKTGEDIEDVSIATDSDFTNPDATKRAKVPTVGAILDGLNDGIYDVSKRNPTAGPNSDGKFALEYILNNANTLIPTSWRHGGMTISFVDSSDNKYVQFRYMSSSTAVADFTNVANWQGVTNEVKAGSSDLVESGAVFNIKKELDTIINGKSVNYIPNKIILGNSYEILDNPGTIVSVELDNILGETIQYISNEGYIAYYKEDGTGYARYAGQGTRQLTIPDSNVIHHVVASFDAANSTFGIKDASGENWLYYPQGLITNGLTDTQIRTAIIGDTLNYSNIVYDEYMNIASADIVYPDGVSGTITNVVVTDGTIQSVDYTYGMSTTYRYSITYDSTGSVVSTNLIKL